MDFREATPADLDSITDLVVATFPMDPGWNYCYPKRLEYPEDHRSCVREKYQNAFKHKDRFIVRVITVPSEEDASVRKLISVASWKRGYTANPTSPETRRDADPVHLQVFEDTCRKARKECFDDVYGDQRLHLSLLCTHPGYQHRGLGASQCRWGLDLAQKERLPVTLFGSPAGRPLYTSLGFKTVAEVSVQAPGEDEKLTVVAMSWQPQSDNGEEQHTPSQPTR